MNPSAVLYAISVWALPVIVAITLHEAAHGYVASKLGDDTALRMGRVSFNPLRHIDPFGTILLPAMLLLAGGHILFGYAKPVPVRFDRLKPRRAGMVLVAAAGPGLNLALALISAGLLHGAVLLPGTAGPWAVQNLYNSLFINVLLAVFNMIPLPPLDGGRVAVGLLPRRLSRALDRLERYGLLLLFGMLLVLPLLGPAIGMDLNVIGWIVGRPAQAIVAFIVRLVGLEGL